MTLAAKVCRPSRNVWPRRIIGLVVLTIWIPNLSAQPPWGRRVERAQPISSHTGFLFVDGNYIDAPYQITAAGNSVKINDLELMPEEYGYERAPIERSEAAMFQRGKRRRFSSTTEQMMTDLALLKVSDAIVFERGQRPVTLESTREAQSLLTTLTSDSPSSEKVPESLEPYQAESWTRLVTEFSATPSFLQRAHSLIESYEEVQQSNQAQADVRLWSEKISYPLTVFAMVIVVFAFGHLLSNKPQVGPDGVDSDSAAGKQVVFRSLVIVGLLSVVDLVWTVVAWQTGSMRELNPLGNRLIENPMQLAVFKLTVVSGSIGLLYWLHQRPIAQLASWWSCLLLTLVTARWLTFNAMFL